ncbi:MAG: hypothetical protein KatS3mg095_0051 [Candidatus Parcubacteria bacterium]|nr:MAG: hypothetical protein KatS3mg095_0051 [Candidatus Parcubacteria bacterium]
MKLSKIYSLFLIINIFLLLIFLFVSNFNYLKLAIFVLLILNLFFLLSISFLKKEELIVPQKDFYIELNNFFNFIETPFVIYDEEMKINYVNDAFSRFVDLDKQSLINLKIETWIVKNEKYLKLALIFFPSLVAENIKIIQAGEPDIIEINYGNKIFISLITTKIIFNKKLFNVKIILDHSQEKKHTQQTLEFLDLLAHHLRTPLNQLKWLIEYNKEAIDQNIYNQELEIINRTIFLTQMVMLSRKDEEGKIELNLELNNIKELINYCLGFFKSSLEDKGIKVEIYLDDNVETFYFDKNIMFFIIYPLIENAIDYNKQNGKIIFDITKDLNRNYIIIKISDTGIGISDEDLKNIFKRYFRSSEAKEIKPTGFGLGLSLVYNLVKAHRGEIKVESKKDIGTTFILEFPISKEIYNL